MQVLEELIESGSLLQVRQTLESLSDKEKRQAGKWLQSYWKTHRDSLDDRAYRESGEYWHALSKGLPLTSIVAHQCWLRLTIANAVLAGKPKEALAIPFPQRLKGFHQSYIVPAEAKQVLLEILAAKGREWLAEYLPLATSGKRLEQQDIFLLLALIRGFDLAWPQEEAFYALWADNLCCLSPAWISSSALAQIVAVLHIDVVTGKVAPLQTLAAETPLAAAMCLPALDIMLTRLLSYRDGVLRLYSLSRGADDQDRIVADMVSVLVNHGCLDRAVVTESLLAALSRGDSVTAQSLQAKLLLAVATDDDLLAPHGTVLLSLQASAHGSAAGVAQTLLRRLDAHGMLAGEFFISVCEMIFARKEKGLQKEQLSWAAQRFATLPGQVSASMAGLFAALGVNDLALQKSVTALIIKYWASLDAVSQESLRSQLVNWQGVTDDGVFRELTVALGASELGSASIAPELYIAPIIESRPVGRFVVPQASAANLRELQAQCAHDASVNVCEQIIAMAVELAISDRHALKLGLQVIGSDFPVGLLEKLQQAAFGKFRESAAVEFHSWDHSDFARLVYIARSRYHEVACAIQQGRPYPLISRPDYTHGAIDASSLVDRLAVLAKQGQVAPDMDFLLALLRTRRPNEAELASLYAIGSARASQAADFFAAGGVDLMVVAQHRVQGERSKDYRAAGWFHPEHPEICVSLQGRVHLPAIKDIDSLWLKGFTPETAQEIWEYDHSEALLTSVLPEHGEILAALALWAFRKAGHDEDTSGGKAAALALPLYLAARGPAGPALHLAVLFCLSANDASARLAGSDGLLELIGQGRYCSDLACQLVADCVACGSVKVARLAKSLLPLLDAGAAQLIWPLLRAALLSAIGRDSPPSGTADLMALASRIVAGLGVREQLDTLAGLASRRGSSKLLIEARRLHELLTR